MSSGGGEDDDHAAFGGILKQDDSKIINESVFSPVMAKSRGSSCWENNKPENGLVKPPIATPGKTRRVFNTVALFHFFFYVHD
jgi:hypothetical protein